jgi:hypothetical protein
MATTTLQARVPDTLARAARSRAKELQIPVSQYLAELVATDLARAEDEHLWARFDAYYDDPAHVAAAQAQAEFHAGTLSDGLPDEDWSNLA